MSALFFLLRNGISLSEPPEVLAVLMLELSEHKDKRRFAAELRKLDEECP
jgi:prophage maintenance system killer protein